MAGGRAVGRQAGGAGVLGRMGVCGPARGCARSGWQARYPRQALRASSLPIAGALRPTRLATARTGNPLSPSRASS
jgi:hypothetical protein